MSCFRPCIGIGAVLAVALTMLAAPAGASARVLEDEVSSFSVRAPVGTHVAFHPRSGAYTISTRRGRVTYLRLRTGASPSRTGRILLRAAHLRTLGVRTTRKSWVARVQGRRTLSVRDSGRSEVTLALWRTEPVHGSASSLRWTLRRIALSARGGRFFPLRRGARVVARATRPAVTVSWRTPAANSLISGPDVDLEVAASRASAVDNVRFLVDGEHIATEHSAPYEASVEARELAAGAHRLRAVATLTNGRLVVSDRIVRTAEGAGAETRTEVPPPLPGGAGNPFFGADFESGSLNPFGGMQAESNDRVRAVTSPGAFAGRYSARFEVRPGDVAAGGNRAEVTGPSFSEGQTVWFRQGIRLASDSALEDRWQQLVQYSTNGEGSPALALFVVGPEAGGKFRFELRRGDSSATFWRSPPLDRDAWHDVAVRVRFSASNSGQVAVYLGGHPQTLANGTEVVSASTIHYGKAYYKTGVYRSSSHTGTSVVYHDRITLGRSASDVGL